MQHHIAFLCFVLLCTVALAGCDRQPSANLASAEQARAEFDRLLAVHGGCTFTDRIMDAGFDLIFLPDGQAVLLSKHISGGKRYAGRYTLVSARITDLDFPGSDADIPDLKLGMDDKSLFLDYATADHSRDTSELSGVMRSIAEVDQAGAAEFAKSYLNDPKKPPATEVVDE